MLEVEPNSLCLLPSTDLFSVNMPVFLKSFLLWSEWCPVAMNIAVQLWCRLVHFPCDYGIAVLFAVLSSSLPRADQLGSRCSGLTTFEQPLGRGLFQRVTTGNGATAPLLQKPWQFLFSVPFVYNGMGNKHWFIFSYITSSFGNGTIDSLCSSGIKTNLRSRLYPKMLSSTAACLYTLCKYVMYKYV